MGDMSARQLTLWSVIIYAAVSCSSMASAALPVPASLQPGDHYHIIFVTGLVTAIDTDTTVPPNIPLWGGIAAADYIVTGSAAAGGLTDNSGFQDITWKAVLSTSTVDARDRINVQGPVYNTHGDLIATDAADLWDGSIANPIKYDESGVDAFGSVAVWTGTSRIGKATADNAGDWQDPTKTATVGSLDSVNDSWIQSGSVFGTSAARLFGISSLLTVPLSGDYNGDGVVDAADYIVWRDTLGQTGAGLAADGNADGIIDGLDYDVWAGHFGQSLPDSAGASATIPEPSTAALLAIGCILALVGASSVRIGRKRLVSATE